MLCIGRADVRVRARALAARDRKPREVLLIATLHLGRELGASTPPRRRPVADGWLHRAVVVRPQRQARVDIGGGREARTARLGRGLAAIVERGARRERLRSWTAGAELV